MFDAGRQEESAADDTFDTGCVPEKEAPEKNTAEKMFDANLDAGADDNVAEDVKQDKQEPLTEKTVPPKINFKDSNLTAEERLLRVIEADGDVAGEKKFPRLKMPDLKNVSAGVKDVMDRVKMLWSDRKFSLTAVNKGIWVAVVFLMIISVVNVFAFKPDIKRVHDRVVKLESRALGSSLILHKPMDEYLSSMARRSLFHPVTNDNNKAQPGAPAVPPGGEDKILGDLQLVGIAWGEYPEAMIRDKNDGRTYFLKKEQQFKGIKVKEISKDRVLVEFGSKSKELM